MVLKEAKANPGIFKIEGRRATLSENRKRFAVTMAKIGLPDPPLAFDSPVPTQQAAINRDAGVVQVADLRVMPNEEQIVASVAR